MISDLPIQLQKIADHLRSEFSGLHIGRANAAMVDEIQVESYGAMMPLKATSNISCPDSHTIRIEPWDKNIVGGIEKALRDAEVGNPQNMGQYIILPVPPMTEERRKQLVKRVSEMEEEARISVRNVRQDFFKKIKIQKDNKEISEDEEKRFEKQIQEKVDATNKTIEEMSKKKSQDILTI